jgi:hypothetical protein
MGVKIKASGKVVKSGTASPFREVLIVVKCLFFWLFGIKWYHLKKRGKRPEGFLEEPD